MLYSLCVICDSAYAVARRRVGLTAACFTSFAFARLVLIAHAMFPAIPWTPVLHCFGASGPLSVAVAGFGMLQQQRRIYRGADVGIDALSAELSAAFFVACTALGAQRENGSIAPDSDWLSAALNLMVVLAITWFIPAVKRTGRS